MRALLGRDGWTVRAVDWGSLPPNPGLWADHVRTVARPAVAELTSSGQLLLVAKSLGTHAARLAAERDLPGVWLTPLLRDDADQRAAYAGMASPALIVGGTADPLWSSQEAEALRRNGWSDPPGARSVVGLADLDHALEVPGDPVASVRACADVMTQVEEFLGRLGSRGA